jgi:hypothetical protein
VRQLGILRKRSPLKLPTAEEATATERTIATIQAELQRRHLRQARKLAKKCAEACRGRDAFGETIYSYLGASGLILQYGAKISKEQHDEAKALLDHSLSVLEPMERHRTRRRHNRR